MFVYIAGDPALRGPGKLDFPLCLLEGTPQWRYALSIGD
jgi:hypothetical protein